MPSLERVVIAAVLELCALTNACGKLYDLLKALH
jgi:hypothetical protein